jgi:uncharacterized protein (DUF169 family)
MKQGRFSTSPVGIKLAGEGEQAPPKARYPLKDLGNRLAVCQGMALARTIGWTMAYKKEDHACPLAPIFLGHVIPDLFLEGAISGPYQETEEAARAMEASYPRWPLHRVKETWLAPLNRCEFEPDLAVVYGNPAQVLSLIQAANFRKGPGLKASSTGRLGCSTWLAGVVQSGECTFMVPGPGERVFAGTQDHEMSFAVPYAKFDDLIQGLEFVSKKGAYRYPVPNLSVLAEPRIPKEYFKINPDFQEPAVS